DVRIIPIGQCHGSRCSILLALDGPTISSDAKSHQFMLPKGEKMLPDNMASLPIRGFACGRCEDEIPYCSPPVDELE
ncbi:unnamed protein product, partial [Mesorhabditis spiculigera]